MRKLVLMIACLFLLNSFVSATTYPSPFITNNNSADVAIIYGTTSGISVLELIQAGNIQTDLQTKSSLEIGGILLKDYEISAVSNRNLIILGTIGNGCSNSAFEEILGKSCDNILSDSGIDTGQFLIQVINNPFSQGKIVLLIEGYEVADLINAVSYLKNNPFDTSIGSKFVEGEKTNEKKCIDSDGLDYYTKGKVTWIYQQGTEKETYTYEDECESSARIHEYICDGDDYSSKEFICPYGCEDGACNEKNLSNIIDKVQLIYDDDYITSLDLIILGNLQTWLYEEGIKNVEIIKNSGVNNDDLEDKISVFVYNREAVVIYGEDLFSLQLVWAGNIQAYLYEIRGKQLLSVCQDLVKSSSVISDDLKEYFCKNILNPSEDNLIDIPDEETFICMGCKSENKCYPFGYRKNEKYCSDELEFKEQKKSEDSCENNFECLTNLCIDNECISSGLWQKFLRFIRKLLGEE